ncbi:MFS transporter [Leifsonia sp. fls2-241-R2A-40a]|uniref:MFS transporter n=1 Tax=Leifsonia sp. fls2-241-R2A-40a TaxID=3040290 RepID=UPI00254A1B5C|nr:MFS transporter [Leifsonia sp. fls2-241-R2A-40a]
MTDPAAGGGVRSLIASAGLPYFPIALFARLPLAMTLIGSITMITAIRGSLAEAGAVSGVLGLTSAFVASVIGIAADRWGQRPVVLVACIGNAIALTGLVVLTIGGAPLWALLLVAVAAGGTSPQIGPMARARWIGLARGRSEAALTWAMGYESTADELTFIIGPLLVALLASTLFPAAPLLLAAFVTAGFGIAFALHPTHAAARAPRQAAPAAPLRDVLSRRAAVVLVGMLMMGAFWGGSLTTLTGFASRAGNPAQAGLIYGVMGIAAGGVAFGAGLLPSRFRLTWRWIAGAGILLIAMVGASTSVDSIVLAAWYFGAGIGVGLTIVTLFSLAAAGAPAGRSSTVMTIMNAGMILGQAITTTVNAQLVAVHGPSTGLVTLILIGLGMLAAASIRTVMADAPRPPQTAAP